VNKTIIDPSISKSGVVPYLPLNSGGVVRTPAPASTPAQGHGQGGTR
jgi:hypothetical protein